MGMFSRPETAVLDEVSERFETAILVDQLETALADAEHLLESYAQVELAMEDRGWRLIGLQAEQQFTREGLRNIATLCRTMAVINPLIRRAIALRTSYIWGDGLQVSARANGTSEDNAEEQDVNDVVQRFLDDLGTRKVLTSAEATETNERALGTDGVFALALFTNPLFGTVQPRQVLSEELDEPICNPQDSSEVWFWKRTTTQTIRDINSPGSKASKTVTTYHPDINYRPRGVRPIRIERNEVLWDAPVVVLNVNRQQGWAFGIGDVFPAIPWARGYKEFLEDWARVVKALSRYVWKVTAGTKKRAATARDGVKNAQGTTDETTTAVAGSRVGGTGVMGPGINLEAIPKSSATGDADAGKPLAAMVSAATDIPVTMLLGDPGVTGARATAETLDTPLILMAKMRRGVWQDFYRQVLDYVIDQAVKAPRGALKGTITRDEWDREVITLAGDTERSLVFEWPDLEEIPLKDYLDAIEKADSTELLPEVELVRLMLKAFRVRDADEIIEANTDDDGKWIGPSVSAGQAAAKAFSRGEDPASALE